MGLRTGIGLPTWSQDFYWKMQCCIAGIHMPSTSDSQFIIRFWPASKVWIRVILKMKLHGNIQKYYIDDLEMFKEAFRNALKAVLDWFEKILDPVYYLIHLKQGYFSSLRRSLKTLSWYNYWQLCASSIFWKHWKLFLYQVENHCNPLRNLPTFTLFYQILHLNTYN